MTFLILFLAILAVFWILSIKRISDRRASYKKDSVVEKNQPASPAKEKIDLVSLLAKKPTPQWNRKTQSIFTILMLIFLILPMFSVDSVKKIYNEWRINHRFIQTTCIVQGRKIDSTSIVGTRSTTTHYFPSILVSYNVQPLTISNWITPTLYEKEIHFSYADAQAALDNYGQGMNYLCWYDPKDFNIVVLEKGYSYALNTLSINAIPMLIMIVVFLFVWRGSVKKFKNRFSDDSSNK